MVANLEEADPHRQIHPVVEVHDFTPESGLYL
jgi:hypothetical protein